MTTMTLLHQGHRPGRARLVAGAMGHRSMAGAAPWAFAACPTADASTAGNPTNEKYTITDPTRTLVPRAT